MALAGAMVPLFGDHADDGKFRCFGCSPWSFDVGCLAGEFTEKVASGM